MPKQFGNIGTFGSIETKIIMPFENIKRIGVQIDEIIRKFVEFFKEANNLLKWSKSQKCNEWTSQNAIKKNKSKFEKLNLEK